MPAYITVFSSLRAELAYMALKVVLYGGRIRDWLVKARSFTCTSSEITKYSRNRIECTDLDILIVQLFNPYSLSCSLPDLRG